jgi:hypothetical protein
VGDGRSLRRVEESEVLSIARRAAADPVPEAPAEVLVAR